MILCIYLPVKYYTMGMLFVKETLKTNLNQGCQAHTAAFILRGARPLKLHDESIKLQSLLYLI